MDTILDWRDWHIPLATRHITLAEAHAGLQAIGLKQDDIPLMVQLVENPKYDIPGFDIFHGKVDLRTHDLIHIVLGRGLLAEDEAFVIGFTMGSTNKVTTTEEVLYGIISKYLYPKIYRFDDRCLAIFRDATKLGYISDCVPLNEVDFDSLMQASLDEVRARIGVETNLLLAYYAIEKRRYPDCLASQRLLVD